ncbi:MAG: GntR family transcriptional regulator [Rhodobacter sp.]|nr:GntR family transcriptional regulator [Rhodobacter sp.]
MNIAEFLDPAKWLSPTKGPRYLQLRRRIEDGIATGFLAPLSPLPPERELATLTGLSRVTVRKATQAMVEDGQITQRQGSGSFIAPPSARVEQSLSRLTSFTEDMARRGFQSCSKWLERGVFLPAPEEVVALALGPNDSVSRIARLRMASDRPMAIERASLPVDLLPNPTEVTTSLYEVLERDGRRPVRAIQKLSAINLGQDDADLLGVETGAAGLRIERTSYLAGGRVVEFTRSIYRGDSYDFVAELRLGTS